MAVPIIDTLSRGQSGIAAFPITVENDIRISYITVNTIADRDAIPEWKRLPYMTCNVVVDVDPENNGEYTLGSNITIAGQVWTAKTYGVPDNVLVEDDILDEDGFIKSQLIRNIFLGDSYVVADEIEMLALTTVTGNFIVRQDNGQVYIKLNNDNPAGLEDFATTSNPASVLSVNGQTGIVTITITNLLDFGTNQTLFDAAVTASPTVADHTVSIGVIQTDIDELDVRVTDLENDTVKKSGDTGLNNLTFITSKGIDSDDIVGTATLNIGVTNADVINIGRVGATVNILGTVNYEEQVNLAIEDKLIRLNVNGAASSGSGVGFEIEEDSLITGYFKTNGDRDGYLFNVPSSTYDAELLLSDLTAHRSYTLKDASGTLALEEYTLSTTLLEAKIIVGNNSDVATAVDLSGDATIDYLGALTIANNAITTAKILDDAVTYAKIQNITSDKLLGRDSAGAGIIEEITPTGGLEFDTFGNLRTTAFTGDVTKTAGGTALTIANDAVTYAKIQDVTATSRFLGRITTGAGIIEELTGAQATTLLNTFTDVLKGLVPPSGGGTTTFLRADGTFATPSGSGHDIYTGAEVTALATRGILRFTGGLHAFDDDPETIVTLGGTILEDTMINGDQALNFDVKNISLFADTPNFEEGEGIVYIKVATTRPVTPPTEGVFMWVELLNGGYEFRVMDSNGTIKGLS